MDSVDSSYANETRKFLPTAPGQGVWILLSCSSSSVGDQEGRLKTRWSSDSASLLSSSENTSSTSVSNDATTHSIT